MYNSKYKSISAEEALNMPEYAHLHDLIRFVETASDSEILPNKYEKGLEYLVSKKVKLLFSKYPNTPLKDVVSVVLQQLPNDISALIILKLTPYIVEEWERFSSNKKTKMTF
jgi:hypothetical protein